MWRLENGALIANVEDVDGFFDLWEMGSLITIKMHIVLVGVVCKLAGWYVY